jgi:hypothetical protein
MADVNHITTIDTFTSDATDRILSILGNSTNIQNVIDIESARWSSLDEAAVELATGLLLTNATGDALDDIGDKLGVSRYDQEDDEYRVAIQIRAYSKTSTTTRTELVEVLAAYTGAYQEQITIIQGSDKRLELGFPSDCFDINNASEEIARLLPLVTNYAVFECASTPLGFASVDAGVVTNPQDFGTLGTVDEEYATGVGILPTLVNTYGLGVYN